MANETQDTGASPVAKAADKARDIVNATKARTEEVAADARDGAYRAANKATTLLTEHPLAAAAAAVAAGAVIGMLLPRWRTGAKIGMTLASSARRAAQTVAAAETAKTLLSGISSAGDVVRTRAQRLAEQAPDAEVVRATATRALARAGEAAQVAGRQVAEKARQLAKTAEIAERAKPTRKTRSTRNSGGD